MIPERQEELVRLLRDYRGIQDFLAKSPRLSFMQFEYALTHGLALFMLEPDFSFEDLEREIDAFLDAMPAIKRIFSKPRIHLKEREEILPTESVRIINNNTIQHLLSHSELWTDIEDGEIKPAKLLTRVYEDNYGIYENLVFCQTVDGVMSFVRAYMRFFKELIYTNQTIEINFLERVNHLNYFLALGKLHIGYSRNLELYYPVSMRCLDKLQRITDGIVPNLKRPVYSKNKFRPAKIKVHKTNILSMDKDYRQIYKLAKLLPSGTQKSGEGPSGRALEGLQKSYFGFCEALCVFAVSHFNFACGENAVIDFSRLDMRFRFRGWELRAEGVRAALPIIALTVKKEAVYKIVLIPTVLPLEEGALNALKHSVAADEYVLCTPYEDDGRERCLVGITGIESFRRIQQILLRGMIYSDGARTDCPFCHNTLTPNVGSDGEPVYECLSCRTQIFRGVCPEKKREYFYTKIAGYRKPAAQDDEPWLAKRKSEAQMFFRNITKLTDDMEPVCPHCGRVHTD